MQALTLGGTNSLSILEWKKLGQQLSATNPKLAFTIAASPAQLLRLLNEYENPRLASFTSLLA